MVLAYDPLEDAQLTSSLQRIFPLCLKMVESFENFENILLIWTIDKVQKKKKDTAISFRKRFRKNT